MGKSHSSRMFMAFVLVFAPMFTFIKESRFYTAWVSPNIKLGKDHMDKMKVYLEAAVELFNEIFPETPLITKSDDRDLQDNSFGLTLDRMTGAGQIPHSQLVLLSADAKAKVPGYCIAHPRRNSRIVTCQIAGNP